jgi:sarcosine oxidase subunit alpha
MTQRFRIAGRGADIDRTRSIRFRFDGRMVDGYAGDTVASALLAEGPHLVGRSFKYHRPRGILSAGAEEPNALLQLGADGARTDPNIRATQAEIFDGLVARSQNRWPSLRVDVGALGDLLSPLFPAGFYYKTFMWPPSPRAWMVYERFVRHAAGLGRAPTAPDPDRYDHRFAHADVLVVGGGVAGLAAALAAGRSGARTILVEDQAQFGGAMRAAPDVGIGGVAALDWVAAALDELQSMPEVTVLGRTTVTGYYGGNFLVGLERVTDHLPPGLHRTGVPRQRLWKIRARQVVLATGAIERPLVFAENDRPAIMLADAVRTYLHRWGVQVGERVALVTNNDGGYATALDLAAVGVAIAAILDMRPNPDGPLACRARQAGLTVLANHTVTGTEGRFRVEEIRAMPMNASGGAALRGTETVIACDAVAMAGGWSPVVHLHSQSGGTVRWDPQMSAFLPYLSVQAERSAGGCAGAETFGRALADGFAAGAAAAADAGFPIAVPPVPEVTAASGAEAPIGPPRPLWYLPSDRPKGAVRAFVDFQNDSTAKDLRLAVREGFVSIEHVKRYTTTGMATDQGKIANVNAIGIVADTLGRPVPEIGTTTFRPPYTPATFAAIAGRTPGRFYAPVRHTPMHDWAAARGAVFENVGQWKRAWYFPKPGEDMMAAVSREARAAREAVALFDASTLGKIDIRGPDAAAFLDRVYTNAWRKLAVGACRYGLMLGEDGMVKDDGVTTRLGPDHFHMTTTTGGAASVLGWLEEWQQTEWPEMRVYFTSVTEQWAVLTVSGPRSRTLLSRLTGIDLSNEAFPHLSMRAGTVAGLSARVFRISFTGEMSWEINVPASHGPALIATVAEAGGDLGLVPYGTEAMHVLRAEKGYIVVGQETDGTVTPDDLGMAWIVSKQKDFIGKRSLSRTDMVRSDRKHLVGLLTADPSLVLPEGAQIVESKTPGPPPVPMLGHVTSSYWSANLGRSIALALLKGGRGRMGTTVHIAREGGGTVPAVVSSPVFVDPDGGRLHG